MHAYIYTRVYARMYAYENSRRDPSRRCHRRRTVSRGVFRLHIDLSKRRQRQLVRDVIRFRIRLERLGICYSKELERRSCPTRQIKKCDFLKQIYRELFEIPQNSEENCVFWIKFWASSVFSIDLFDGLNDAILSKTDWELFGRQPEL